MGEYFSRAGDELYFKGRKKKFLYKRVTILLVCMLGLASFFVYSPLVKAEEANVQQEVQEVYLSFDPSGLKRVEVGKELGVSLLVENVHQLAGVGLEIKYNPGVLECLPVKQEQPLEPGEVFKQNYFPVKNEVDAQNGILRFAALVELPFKDGFSGT